ncbi:hypothetical protein K458DRAFT_312748 [Lentithecium fluviatile CBS 122367]|uniref:Reverse transcriptase domain-containing protein n=1 Tax=Lentithecium fluviatile CBS 122367 TaxID=1168545 RepID=A0A6G1IQ77_9PLEO|nr:hypothetical protein K458DRAFT_312748 [Lentithecium fluviatile CBS 122367]
MPSSGSVFSETLQTITTTKLAELAEQRLTFEKEYAAILEATSKESDVLKRVLILANGVKSALGVLTAYSKPKRAGRVQVGASTNRVLETDLKNLDRFLEQTRYDPSVSSKVIEDWEKMLFQYLSVQSAKYEYAALYGRLVTEWLSSEKGTSADDDVDMAESFEEVPGAKRLEARAEWEKVVFVPLEVDVHGLQDYLQTLFITGKKNVENVIRTLREKTREFESNLSGSKPFSVSNLRWVIEGLQSSDLLANEKREVLKDFLSNDIILGEIGDVLNMRMASLSRWTWGDHVPLEQRRKLNGTFTVHLDEDLLQAIFLHYIGVKWSVFFKNAFVTLRQSVAWKSNHVDIPKIDRLRRQYYLGPRNTSTAGNLEYFRANKHKEQYCAHQLLDHDQQKVQVEEGEEEAEFGGSDDRPRKRGRAKQTARNTVARHSMMQNARREQVPQMPSSQMSSFNVEEDDSEESYHAPPKRPMQAKQDLLHMLSTEAIINTRLYGELTCFRSVFESWNPLLPHDTILHVLEFLGVSDRWRTFFKTFLEAPLKFTDDESATPRLRRRGTPGSHALSDVFGEVVLACLDFSVNQATDGGMLHRLYDDIWFWSKDYEKCAQAWASVVQFTKTMGVEVNESKTGSVRIARDSSTELAIDDRLPAGEIRWGFLYLDSATGHFEIDGKMVDAHIEELRKQLQGKTKSVIGWINAYNQYAATFFSSNFGKAANCFGRTHVDKMLATHRRIQDSIFEGGNVVQFLRDTIEERFGVKGIPDGFLFLPVELGGLELKSAFVPLLQIRESVKENPYKFLEEFEEQEAEDYKSAKRTFDRGEVQTMRYSSEDPTFVPSSPKTFFSFDEFVRFREEYKFGQADLVRVYCDLLARPIEEPIDVSVQINQAIEQLKGQSNLRGVVSDWARMEPYWKWIAQMYGPNMIEKFGGLNVVDLGLLPIGMVSMLRQKRMKWEG